MARRLANSEQFRGKSWLTTRKAIDTFGDASAKVLGRHGLVTVPGVLEFSV